MKEVASKFLSDNLSVLKMSSANVDELGYGIMDALRITQEKFAKSRYLTVNSSSEIISPKIIKLKNWRNKLKKWSNDKTAFNWTQMLRGSRILRGEVRRARKLEIKSKMKKSPKEFWGVLNKMMGKSSGGV